MQNEVGGVPGVAVEVFGAGSIVVGIDDEGVVEAAGGLERGDDLADGLVHVIHHGGVDGLVADAPFLVVDGVPILPSFFGSVPRCHLPTIPVW